MPTTTPGTCGARRRRGPCDEPEVGQIRAAAGDLGDDAGRSLGVQRTVVADDRGEVIADDQAHGEKQHTLGLGGAMIGSTAGCSIEAAKRDSATKRSRNP